MLAISPDMRMAAPHCQVPGRPHVLTTVEDERNPSIMAHPQPVTVEVPVEVLQALAEKAQRESIALNRLLDAAGVDLAPQTHQPVVDRPTGRVVRLADWRAYRHGGAA